MNEFSIAAILWRLAGLLALVFANGFFVSAEFSIVTVRKTRIDQLIAEGHTRARAVRRAITSPDRYIAATQLGITMTSLGLGWLGEPALANLIQPPLRFLPAHLAEATAHTVAVTIAFVVITAVHIVLGELAPKWVTLERPETTALWVVKPTELFMQALWPFIRLLHGTARAIVAIAGVRGEHRAGVHSEEELKMLVTASQEAGQLPLVETNNVALLTRPIMCGGVSRCRSELPTIVHSAACTPNAAITAPTTYTFVASARVRCVHASTSSPIRIVQDAVNRLITRSPTAEPSTVPAAMHVNSDP